MLLYLWCILLKVKTWLMAQVRRVVRPRRDRPGSSGTAAGGTQLRAQVEGEGQNAALRHRQTPLVGGGASRAAARLLSPGADPTVADVWGLTPLHDAAYKGNEAIVLMLLAAGADPFARDNAGRTPFDVATTDAVRRLLAPPPPLLKSVAHFLCPSRFPNPALDPLPPQLAPPPPPSTRVPPPDARCPGHFMTGCTGGPHCPIRTEMPEHPLLGRPLKKPIPFLEMALKIPDGLPIPDVILESDSDSDSDSESDS